MMRTLSLGIILAIAPLATAPLVAQQHVTVATIPADPKDVSTVDGIMKAFYDVISGPAGEPREWSRDRTLYIADMRFVAMDVDQSGKPVPSIMSHQQFVDRSDAGLVKNGFYEEEIHRVTRKFGNITHVFSTYTMRQQAGGPLIGRGVNSIQLFWDGTRWWIANATWDDERKDNPIPEEFLP